MAYNHRRRPPSPGRRGEDMYQFRGNDARQQDSRHGFDFRAPNHSAPSFPPSGPAADRTRNGRYDRRGNRDRQPGRGRGGYRKPGASQRAILFSRRSPTPEQLPGMSTGDNSFRVLEVDSSDADDDDESASVQPSKATTDNAESEDSEEEDHPRSKRAKVTSDSGDQIADSKPKWSNPDPYTALPPPGESQAPRTDVLAMIRKAKVQNEAAADQAVKVDEFISLDFGGDEAADVQSISSDNGPSPDSHRNNMPVRGAARDRPGQGRNDQYPSRGDNWAPQPNRGFSIRGEADRSRYGRSRSRSPPRREYGYSRRSSSPEAFDRWGRPYPPAPRNDYPQYDTYSTYSHQRDYDGGADRYGREPYRADDRYHDGARSHPSLPQPLAGSTSRYAAPPPPPPAYSQDSWAPPPPPMPSSGLPPPPSLDVWPPPMPVPGYKAPQPAADLKKRKRGVGAGPSLSMPIASAWLPRGDASDTPWMTYCDPKQPSERWLHNEVECFFFYTSPRDSERKLRADLIERLTAGFTNGRPTLSVLPFGSSATNLYLPTGDVDLVVLSDYFRSTRFPSIATSRNGMQRLFRDCVQARGISNYCQIIHKAKVPLIKFNDDKTGLPVDVSFENDSGLNAITTLNYWLDQYPALSRLVFPLKQFLKMRGINEVNTGGMGGFSTICLVAFRLHNLGVQHGKEWALHNLDVALIDVFDYFSKFDVDTYGLDMYSMDLIPKSSWLGYRPSQPGRLLIVDPNDSNNDISGGTGKIQSIFAMFGLAADALKKELSRAQGVRYTQSQRWSMLNSILGANYTSFDNQRGKLEALYEREKRSRPDWNLVDLTTSDEEYEPAGVSATIDGTAERSSLPPRPDQLFKAVNGNVQHQTAHEQKPPTKPAGPNAKKRKADKSKPNATQPAKKKKKAKANPVAGEPTQANGNEATRAQKRAATAAKKKAETKEVTFPSKKKKAASKPDPTAERKRVIGDKQRAAQYKEKFPGAACPNTLSKTKYREMVKAQSQA